MLVSSADHSEIRLTIELAMELVNGLRSGTLDARSLLINGGFSRADEAPDSEVAHLIARMTNRAGVINDLPELDTAMAAQRINAVLAELPIAPAIVDHGDVGPHMHWTPTASTFDDQVIADIFMAFAQVLCSDGTRRFGRCAATDCGNLFYDSTRNRSRRFCADPRCASRTHTAEYRREQKTRRPLGRRGEAIPCITNICSIYWPHRVDMAPSGDSPRGAPLSVATPCDPTLVLGQSENTP
ncbi:MAG: CGNR zinc finger domain-containing protein [Acidimicrobiales bacterium]